MKFSPICKTFLMILCTDERQICASHAIFLTEQWLCEWSSWLCTDLMFSALGYVLTMVNHWQGVQLTQSDLSIFSSKWLKRPRDHFLFGNSQRNSCAVYCFLLRLHQQKAVLCLSVSTATTECHKLLHHHKVRMVQLLWLNLIIELATVSVIRVQENCKNQNNHTIFDEKATGLFLWIRCIMSTRL